MMDLKMEVYSPGLELLGLLEIQNSVIWERKAFSSGSFSVEALITDESRTLLVPENILWIAGEDAGIIEYIQEEAGEDGPYITVKGCDLTGILERRILWGLYSLSGPVPALMYQLVDDCCIHPTRGDVEARVIPNLRLSDVPAGGTSIQSQKTGGSLLEALEALGEAYQVPFGVRFVPEVPCMEFWARPGVDRSVHQAVNEPVFYSTELDDVLSSEYSYNAQDYKNVALVAGEGEGKDRAMVVVVGKVETVPAPPTPPEPVVKYTVTLSVDPAGGGLASGGGEAEEGERVAVTAAPAAGYSFSGWSEGGTIVSTSLSYTFTVTGDRTLTAVFAAIVPTYIISASIDPAGSGTVTGAGSYQEGQTVTLTAAPEEGYNFAGWQEAGQTVSTDAEYTFTVSEDRKLTAVFKEAPQYIVGVDWWEATLPETANWISVAYGDGKFVAIAHNSNKAAYSLDGITWTMTTLPKSTYWQDVVYGDGKFVAIESGYTSSSARIGAYSLDGIVWTQTNLPKYSWVKVAYGDGAFVAVTNGNDLYAARSTDGITWGTSLITSTGRAWGSIAYGADKFAIVSWDVNVARAMYSENGINWRTGDFPSKGYWISTAYGNGKFVTVNNQKGTGAAYSLDGITWTASVLPVSANWIDIAYGEDRFVAIAYNNNVAAYSEDGIDWTAVTLPSSGNWQCLAYGDGKFVSLAYGSNKLVYSSARGPES